jgi:nucleoid-associated protein YgaU
MTKKKSILDKVIDAVSSRDEKEEAEEAKKEAEAAKRKAALEAAKRQAAEAKARAAEAKAKKAEEEAAAEAKAKVEAAKREAQLRAAKERAAKARELAAAKARTYVVQPGDSLSKIAKEVLGDASRWPEIFEANKDQIKDPNLIHPGQELKMPS